MPYVKMLVNIKHFSTFVLLISLLHFSIISIYSSYFLLIIKWLYVCIFASTQHYNLWWLTRLSPARVSFQVTVIYRNSAILFENLALNLHYARAGISGKSSVCINLIFTTKQSLIINSGFHAASIPNITDKIICEKFNLINNLIIWLGKGYIQCWCR